MMSLSNLRNLTDILPSSAPSLAASAGGQCPLALLEFPLILGDDVPDKVERIRGRLLLVEAK